MAAAVLERIYQSLSHWGLFEIDQVVKEPEPAVLGPMPPKFNPEGLYTIEYQQWLNRGCEVCDVDGQDGSCLIGLTGCKWY